MRSALFALLVLLAAAACVAKPLTTPEAKPVVPRPTPPYGKLPSDMLVLVDGTRLAPGQSVDDLDPTTVATVEILKGTLARSLYGDEGGRGVILIATKRGKAAPPRSR